MQSTKELKPAVAIIISAKNEGILLVPTIRSAIASSKDCFDNGVTCEIHLLGFDPDEKTRSIISRYTGASKLINLHEVDDEQRLKDHLLSKIKAEFYCFLSAPDLIQTQWPRKAYEHAKRSNYQECIFHPEISAEFGNISTTRIQLSSKDPAFHQIHAAISEHFPHDFFAHTKIIEQAPSLIRESNSSSKFETWNWSCETLAIGIARDFVPETVHFKRENPSRKKPHSIQKSINSEIFRNLLATRDYGKFCGLDDSSDANQLAIKSNIRYREPLQNWLYREIKLAAKYDSDVFDLLKAAPNLLCETPEVNVAASFLLSRVATLEKEGFIIFGVDCETIADNKVGVAELGIRQIAKNRRVLVLCGDILTSQKITRETDGILYFNLNMALRSGGEYSLLSNALSLIISNFSPAAIINMNLSFLDNYCGTHQEILKSKNIPTVRILQTDLEDIHSGYDDRRTLALLNQRKNFFTHLAVTTEENLKYVRSLYSVSDTKTILTQARLSYIDNLIEKICDQVPSDLSNQGESSAAVPNNPVVDAQVTCILNLHREGEIVIPTLRSIERMIDYAQHQGLKCELVIILDNSDSTTRRIVTKAQSDILTGISTSLIEVENGDLGMSRRDGVKSSNGQYIAFLDGDDLYSKNWISEAYFKSQNELNSESTVYHPQLNLYFGEHSRTFYHPDADNLDKNEETALLLENLWTSLSFGHRSIYIENPVHDNGLDDGYGYEDWHWNMDTTAKSIKHRPVPQTIHFIRLKPTGSLNHSSSSRSSIVRPSRLAHKLLFTKHQNAAPEVDTDRSHNLSA